MFPNELKRLNNFVCWALIDGKKVPINPHTGKGAISTDASTWASYETAIEAAKKYGSNGIGFVFDGNEYVGIDLDHCIVDGKLNPFAQEIVDRCRSYSEISPSGTGVHIIVKADLPWGALKTGKKDAAGKVIADAVEVYNTGRYFTITDNSVPLTVPFVRNVDVSFLYPADRQTAKAPPIKERLASISEGNRNSTFLSLAGSLRSSGKLDNITIYELLKPKAEQEKFSLEELWSVCNRYPDNGVMASPVDDTDDFAAFMADRKPKQWFCKPFITKETLGFFVGLPEALKTWAAMDLALECIRGGKWLNKYDVKAGRVFFIDQERPKDETQNRFAALLKEKALTTADVSGKLIVKCGTTFRLDHQQSFEGLKRRMDVLQPTVVIWDSWRTACSGDDKDSGTVQSVLECAKEIRARYGCAVIFIDHENKNTFQVIREKEAPNYGNQNGSIAKPAAAEFILTFRKDETQGSWVYHTKCTQGRAHAPFLMRVRDTTPIEGESIAVEAI